IRTPKTYQARLGQNRVVPGTGPGGHGPEGRQRPPGTPALRPGYPIRTPRLVLRPFTRGDLDALYEFHRLPEVNRFLYSEPKDRDQVTAMLAEKAASTVLRKEGQALHLAAELAGSRQLVGDCTLFWRSQVHRQGEIG